jgi:hypothetical protein
MAEDEGISIPSVPKPIRAQASERDLPEAPVPGRAGQVLTSERHVPRHEHFHPPKPPPLFIKIDKYQEVVDNLQRLKSFALSLRDALDALADIEKELTTGVSIAHKALDDFNSVIALLESKMTRVGEIETARSGSTPKEVDNYIRNVYEQMDRIKQELDNVSADLE